MHALWMTSNDSVTLGANRSERVMPCANLHAIGNEKLQSGMKGLTS
jgi:hypothetical protein